MERSASAEDHEGSSACGARGSDCADGSGQDGAAESVDAAGNKPDGEIGAVQCVNSGGGFAASERSCVSWFDGAFRFGLGAGFRQPIDFSEGGGTQPRGQEPHDDRRGRGGGADCRGRRDVFLARESSFGERSFSFQSFERRGGSPERGVGSGAGESGNGQFNITGVESATASVESATGGLECNCGAQFQRTAAESFCAR